MGMRKSGSLGETGMSEGQRDGSADAQRGFEKLTGRRRGDRIVGASRATQQLVDQATAAARTELPVLLVGPSGSGKEHVARAIHSWSSRASGPLVGVACDAVAEALIGREIFGSAEGVFRLLPEEHVGALARASGGTLLLDGIDGLPAGPRESLVKALSEGRFQREGDGAHATVRARVIATSIATLPQTPFGDLPHFTIELPALAERNEDILPLAAHFLRIAADEAGVPAVGFTADARSALLAESWPGNVRELAERVRQAIRLAGGGSISAEALLLAADGEEIPSFKEAKRAFETRYVVGLLRRCGGNISRAARLAKKDRKDFYDVIRRTGVNPSEFR